MKDRKMHLEIRNDPDGLQHYLDGKRVEDAAEIELFHLGEWKRGQYSWTRHPGDPPCLVTLEFGTAIQDVDELRWPENSGA
jgi:hypothetical protein